MINSKKVSGMNANSIEENEKTVDKNDIKDCNVSKLKPGFHLNALKYILKCLKQLRR